VRYRSKIVFEAIWIIWFQCQKKELHVVVVVVVVSDKKNFFVDNSAG
jgi:hypothetical protein